MKCVICGDSMRLEPLEKYDHLYFGAMSCSNCGRRELASSKLGPRL